MDAGSKRGVPLRSIRFPRLESYAFEIAFFDPQDPRQRIRTTHRPTPVIECVQSAFVWQVHDTDELVPRQRLPFGGLVTLQSSQTETAAPLATEIYGFEGAVVQTRGDGPSTQTEFAELGALMLYREQTKAWETIPDIDRAFNRPGANSPSKFFEALASDQPVPVSMHDGRRCVVLLEAAERAEAEKRQVEIAEVEA